MQTNKQTLHEELQQNVSRTLPSYPPFEPTSPSPPTYPAPVPDQTSSNDSIIPAIYQGLLDLQPPDLLPPLEVPGHETGYTINTDPSLLNNFQPNKQAPDLPHLPEDNFSAQPQSHTNANIVITPLEISPILPQEFQFPTGPEPPRVPENHIQDVPVIPQAFPNQAPPIPEKPRYMKPINPRQPPKIPEKPHLPIKPPPPTYIVARPSPPHTQSMFPDKAAETSILISAPSGFSGSSSGSSVASSNGGYIVSRRILMKRTKKVRVNGKKKSLMCDILVDDRGIELPGQEFNIEGKCINEEEVYERAKASGLIPLTHEVLPNGKQPAGIPLPSQIAKVIITPQGLQPGTIPPSAQAGQVNYPPIPYGY